MKFDVITRHKMLRVWMGFDSTGYNIMLTRGASGSALATTNTQVRLVISGYVRQMLMGSCPCRAPSCRKGVRLILDARSALWRVAQAKVLTSSGANYAGQTAAWYGTWRLASKEEILMPVYDYESLIHHHSSLSFKCLCGLIGGARAA